VIESLAEIGVVPVVELGSVDGARPMMEALLAGGCPVAEITLRSAAGLDAIGLLRGAYPEALVGAGTVRTLDDARAVIDAGAMFVVSPGTNVELVASCREAGVTVLPGACTPTEVDTAVRAGADAVKFFPAEAMGGIPVLKALAGPFRDVSFVPTGGVSAANLASYLALSNVIACGGSWMVAPALLADGEFARVERLAREAVEMAAAARAGAAV
jgi:2-dehydro-3-deoxyphosphogluconate aldolase / (4S)-4-hydroxy-2-oxoglutarate aldolase